MSAFCAAISGIADVKRHTMKHAITIRIDPELLEQARTCAKQENRTVTNFIETILKERIGVLMPSPVQKRRLGRRRSNLARFGAATNGPQPGSPEQCPATRKCPIPDQMSDLEG
jgi:hypothetical protein